VTDQPLIGDERLRDALSALGLHDVHSADPGRQVTRAVLAGALLALAELAADQADPAELTEGHRWALDTILRDELAAQRWSARLARERLHRTADTLPRPGVDELPLTDVAGPAILAAANILVLLHQSPPPSLVNQAVDAAGANLRSATQSLFSLRAALARAGYPQ
jgi:hypothetical protein